MHVFSAGLIGRLALGLLAVSVPLAARSGTGAAASAAPDRREIEGVVQGFEDAWNRHDMKALAALFTEKADFVNVIGLHWRGREEIERAHAAIHATRMKDSQLASLSRTVRYLRPDVALVHASWELRGDTGLDGKSQPPRRGVLSFVVVKQAGRWLVESAQNTDIVPIPNAPAAR